MTYASVLVALADPTRREIVHRLRNQPRTVTELATALPVSQPAVSQHLRVLRETSLVSQHRESLTRVYSLNAAPLEEVNVFTTQFEKFWSKTFDRLGAQMDQDG